MKRIEVTVGLHKLSEAYDALRAIGVDGTPTNEAHGNVCRKMQDEVSAGGEVGIGLSETKLEIVVSAERAAAVIRAFAGPGWRDLLGDGKIVVYEIADRFASTHRSHAKTHAD